MKTIKQRLTNLLWLSITIFTLSIIAGTTIHIFASFTEPLTAPSASDQDFPENILGANNADNEYNSDLVTGNQDGSMIERLEHMDDIFFGYSKQQFQVYDDYNCANNNDEGTDSACGAGDPEYVGEEGVWASSTDLDISTEYIVSGIVKRDQRTGLFWSDAYDSTQGGDGAENTIDNDFEIWDDGSCLGDGSGTDCSDADIINGDCESVNFDCYDNDGDGSALDFCLDLSLDADGDGTDETDWRLPTQKELLQAYINGIANNVPNPAHYYWSSTEHYINPSNAWNVNLSNGGTNVNNKTLNNYARCVRR